MCRLGGGALGGDGTMKRKQSKPSSSTVNRGNKGDPAFRIKLRGPDGEVMTVRDLQQDLFEAARRLDPYAQDCRVKWATLYLTFIDEHGSVVRLPAGNEWTVHPYQSAADEYDA